VITEENAPNKQAPREIAIRVGWFVLIAATLYVCYFSHLGAIGFVGPDEPRYAWVARAMVETGDWVTPKLYGRPWFEKPVLYYWGAALSFKLFGVNEAAARLPSAVSALLATLAMAWLAWWLYGGETARWLLLLLPTSFGMIGFSHAAATDMPFSGMLTVAMVAVMVMLRLVPSGSEELATDTNGSGSSLLVRTVSSQLSAAFAFGIFLGAAALAKGPAAIILCGGAVLVWAAFTKRWRDALRLLHPAGIVAFCATALPWYVLCALRNPDFFRVFIVEHNFKRYLTPEFQHIQPFWYYIPVLCVALLPWSAALAWSAVKGSAYIFRERRVSAATGLLLSWCLFTIVFFSLSQSKLPGYVLPAIPAMTLVFCHSIQRLVLSQRESFRLMLFVFGFVFSAFAGLMNLSHPHLSSSASAFKGLATFSALVIAWANWGLSSAVPTNKRHGVRYGRFVLGILAIPTALLLLMIGFSNIDDGLPNSVSPRRIAAAPAGVPTDYWLKHVSMFRLRRANEYALNFYLRQELKEWDGKNDSRQWIFTESRNVPKLQTQGLKCTDTLSNLNFGAVICAVPSVTSTGGGEF
jgi:4-amino-4-deoxy-L-arabinose transferase-like glycosyltransferase